jgi:hypothetical protein
LCAALFATPLSSIVIVARSSIVSGTDQVAGGFVTQN